MAKHARITDTINRQGWHGTTTLPVPGLRAALATTLLRLAARLAPAEALLTGAQRPAIKTTGA